jgi:hypothetical protein
MYGRTQKKLATILEELGFEQVNLEEQKEFKSRLEADE